LPIKKVLPLFLTKHYSLN